MQVTPSVSSETLFTSTYVEALWHWVQQIEAANVVHKTLLSKYGLDPSNGDTFMPEPERCARLQAVFLDAEYPHHQYRLRPLPAPFTHEFAPSKTGSTSISTSTSADVRRVLPVHLRSALDSLEDRLRQQWHSTRRATTPV